MNDIPLNSLGKYRSFDSIPVSVRNNIREFLKENGYLSLEEYEYHLKLNEKSFIIIKWAGNYSLEVFTFLKLSELQIHGKKFNCLVSFMYEYIDYNPFYTIYPYDQCMSLIGNLFKEDRLDLISVMNTYFVFNDAKFKSSEQIGVYDGGEDLFSNLLSKKSIKRKYKYLISNREIDINHTYLNQDISEKLVNEVKDLHIERWAFDDVESGFVNDDYREKFYKHSAGNKIVSTIRDKDTSEIISVHYGFILANSLLWHTPLINIKYYDYSPLEVLLKIMFEFCRDNKINFFDFGLGSEQYKSRFVNNSKTVFSYYYPLNYKSKLYLKLIDKNKNFLNKQIKNLRNFKYFVNNLLLIKNSILFYSSLPLGHENILKDERFLVIKDWELYVNLCRKVRISISKSDYNRIKNGNYFYCLLEKDQILCSGWGTKETNFYVLEINKKISFNCDIILYDFNTPFEYRSKGHYKSLLNSIIDYHKTYNLGIFAKRSNHHSNNAIEKVGFRFQKEYRTYNWL